MNLPFRNPFDRNRAVHLVQASLLLGIHPETRGAPVPGSTVGHGAVGHRAVVHHAVANEDLWRGGPWEASPTAAIDPE